MTTGERGETIAADYLTQQGFTVLRRNYHTRYGEIDIICADAQYLVFAEVKTRSSRAFGAPCEAVTVSKQRKIIRAAQQWLLEHPTDLQPRFDVAEVQIFRDDVHIHLIPNAFEVQE